MIRFLNGVFPFHYILLQDQISINLHLSAQNASYEAGNVDIGITDHSLKFVFFNLINHLRKIDLLYNNQKLIS